MKPRDIFLNQPKYFWAYVRTISECAGYTEIRKGPSKGKVKTPDLEEIKKLFSNQNLDISKVISTSNKPTKFGELLLEYFKYRAQVLNSLVEPWLMDKEKGKVEFNKLFSKLSPSAPIPMNKQKGDKKAPAYFTGIINMLIEANASGYPCNYDPQKLVKFTSENAPLRTMARRVDGAFPSVLNPLAVWEIKEYYNTTTFGSRVAGGVYETLLDGMELDELYLNEGRKVRHYLMVDAHYTWWGMGKSYLCRMVDMLHMGYVDEVLFGYEIIERLPEVVQEWVKLLEFVN